MNSQEAVVVSTVPRQARGTGLASKFGGVFCSGRLGAGLFRAHYERHELSALMIYDTELRDAAPGLDNVAALLEHVRQSFPTTSPALIVLHQGALNLLGNYLRPGELGFGYLVGQFGADLLTPSNRYEGYEWYQIIGRKSGSIFASLSPTEVLRLSPKDWMLQVEAPQ